MTYDNIAVANLCKYARKVNVNLHSNVQYRFMSKYHINEVKFNSDHGVQYCVFNKYLK